MRRRRRVLIGAGVLALVLAGSGYAAAQRHVRTVTGRADAKPTWCGRCHGTDGPVVYATGSAHPDPRALAVSPDGATVVAACGPASALAVIDVGAAKLRRYVRVEGRPRNLAFSADGATLAVTYEDRDAVALLDAETFAERSRVAVGASPSGVAFNGDGSLLFVANRHSGDVSVVDVESGRERVRVDGGREPYAVARSPDGRFVAVLSRSAETLLPHEVPVSLVTLFDGARGTVLRRVPLESCHMAEDLEFTPDGERLLVPAVRVRNLLPIVQVARSWVMSSTLVTIDPSNGALALLPLNSVNTNLPDPSGIALSADGTRAWIASG